MRKNKTTILITALALIALMIWAFHTPDLPLETIKEKYTNPASRFAAIEGMQVHYRDEGPHTDSLPLLLLHGTASSLHTWDSLVLKFPHKRIIRLDLPGYGITGPHPTADYSTQMYMRVLDTIAAQLAIDRWVVAGNSFGGLLAWQYALQHPSVKGLVLIDAAGFPSKVKGGNLGFRIARMPVLNQLVKYFTPKSLFEKSLQQSFGNPNAVNDALVTRHYELTLRPGNRKAIIDRFSNRDKIDTTTLAAIKIPVLIQWGSLDQVIPVENAWRFHHALSNPELVVYPKLGHVPMEEDASALARDIQQWLNKL
ncbi:MAG: alpha/beta hydrolase [Bacteroidetes bacterium]|nr:alpha/beta hydrolase [Bacteroidota bacterium]